MSFKTEINKHLKAYDKTELVDSYLIDQAGFCLREMEKLQKEIEKDGATNVANSGFVQKSGRVSSYESFLKGFITICKELGLSPQARKAWVKQIIEKKTKADRLIT